MSSSSSPFAFAINELSQRRHGERMGVPPARAVCRWGAPGSGVMAGEDPASRCGRGTATGFRDNEEVLRRRREGLHGEVSPHGRDSVAREARGGGALSVCEGRRPRRRRCCSEGRPWGGGPPTSGEARDWRQGGMRCGREETVKEKYVA
jgi:hypothetical protein